MTKHRLETTCWGERYSVEWTGSVYRRDDNGEQSADGHDLLRGCIENAAEAGGDDPEDTQIADAIDEAVGQARIVGGEAMESGHA